MNAERQASWLFWAACATAGVAGVLPFVLARGGRAGLVTVPYLLAAAALGACALLEGRGRGPATALYLLAGLAIVYGILGMFAVLVQFAVLGAGIQPPTSSETLSFGWSIGLGVLAILIGFAGLAALYRRIQSTPLPPNRPTVLTRPVPPPTGPPRDGDAEPKEPLA